MNQTRHQFARVVTLERAATEAMHSALSGWRWREGRGKDPDVLDGICAGCGATFRKSGKLHDYAPLCPCEEKVLREARASYIAEHRPPAVEALWDEAGVPARFGDRTFESFQLRRGTERPLKACRAFVEAFSPETTEGLWFIGSYGAGKTHLAVATLRAALEGTLASVRFTTASDLIAAVRPGEDERNFHWAEVDEAIRADLLVLDDLGQEQSGDFSRDVIYRTINGRYEANRPLIVTTNAGDEQLERRYGGATVSRLLEMARPVIFSEEVTDYRTEIRKARRSGAAA